METLEVFRTALSAEVGLDSGRIGYDTDFGDLEVDYITVLAVLERIRNDTGVEVPASVFRDCSSLSEVRQRLMLDQAASHQEHLRSPVIKIREPSCLQAARDSFAESTTHVGEFAEEARSAGFFANVYPAQRRLVLAYLAEAMARLGCDLDTMAPGTVVTIPQGILSKHTRLFRGALFEILEDGGLVERQDDDRVVRTAAGVDKTTTSSILYKKIIQEYPAHAVNTHQLLNVTGSAFADCLVGTADPIKLLFGQNKHLLEEFYTNAPMSVAASKHLAAFFKNAFLQTKERPIQILEVGAGLGGTTKFILEMLVDAGIPFRYVFTDITNAFLTAAKKRYAHLPPATQGCIEYTVLDIEKTPPAHLQGGFHAVFSTNCIHATKDLKVSSENARKLLRPGGFFALVEFTTRLYWLDLVFGLLDGWWLFEDGRKHCIATETIWKEKLMAAGFAEVLWTPDGGYDKENPKVIIACKD